MSISSAGMAVITSALADRELRARAHLLGSLPGSSAQVQCSTIRAVRRLGLADGFISERMQVTCLAGATIGSSPCRATL